MNAVERLARALQARGLLRYLPVTALKHYVYPFTVRRPRRPADASAYWESWYRSVPEGGLADRDTISPTTSAVEARLHYAAIEIALLGWLARDGVQPERVLDIGSGSGHWIRLYRDTLGAGSVLGVEIAASAVERLHEAFAGVDGVQVRCADIGEAGLQLGRTFDLVNAIGVMFHIVDDTRWQHALHGIARHLEPGGHAIIGGQFGWITRDVQFHNRDDFTDWEHQRAPSDVALVNKRIRSLRHWRRGARAAGLDVVEVVRTQRVPAIVQPESHLLVLRKPG